MVTVYEFALTIDPFGVYDHADLAEAFLRETGQQPCWLPLSVESARAAIKARGKGGHVNGTTRVVFGDQALVAMAMRYANDARPATFRGVGTRARVALESLRDVGNER